MKNGIEYDLYLIFVKDYLTHVRYGMPRRRRKCYKNYYIYSSVTFFGWLALPLIEISQQENIILLQSSSLSSCRGLIGTYLRR